jgi:hypothetical protein
VEVTDSGKHSSLLRKAENLSFVVLTREVFSTFSTRLRHVTGNTKGGSITVLLTTCLTGLD